MDRSAVHVESAFDRVTDYWSPKVIGRVNDQYLKVATLLGEFVRHQHDDEDELFLVVRGRLTLELDDGRVVVGPGEFYVVPKGTPHRPVAEEECWVLLVETVTTKHTGDVESPLTRSVAEQLA
jgi:mannose-6-phosphate isomerase-like protein (cupin superfamily)